MAFACVIAPRRVIGLVLVSVLGIVIGHCVGLYVVLGVVFA